jgi:hypothetical protein
VHAAIIAGLQILPENRIVRAQFFFRMVAIDQAKDFFMYRVAVRTGRDDLVGQPTRARQNRLNELLRDLPGGCFGSRADKEVIGAGGQWPDRV